MCNSLAIFEIIWLLPQCMKWALINWDCYHNKQTNKNNQKQQKMKEKGEKYVFWLILGWRALGGKCQFASLSIKKLYWSPFGCWSQPRVNKLWSFRKQSIHNEDCHKLTKIDDSDDCRTNRGFTYSHSLSGEFGNIYVNLTT